MGADCFLRGRGERKLELDETLSGQCLRIFSASFAWIGFSPCNLEVYRADGS